MFWWAITLGRYGHLPGQRTRSLHVLDTWLTAPRSSDQGAVWLGTGGAKG